MGCAELTQCLRLRFLIQGLVPLCAYVSALSERCVCLAHGAEYRVKSAEPIPWIWDIVLLPEFWGFFLLLLLFPRCNLTDTDVQMYFLSFFFFFPQDSRNLSASVRYFQWYLHPLDEDALPLDLMHPAFLHSCGFPSPLLWVCPWGLSCVCLSWPFVHSAWACDLLSCLRGCIFPRNILILFPEMEWKAASLSKIASWEHWWALHICKEPSVCKPHVAFTKMP